MKIENKKKHKEEKARKKWNVKKDKRKKITFWTSLLYIYIYMGKVRKRKEKYIWIDEKKIITKY